MVSQILGDNGADGVVMGNGATVKMGFFGEATPVVRPSITAVATTTATTTLNELKINRLYAALNSLGIVATDG